MDKYGKLKMDRAKQLVKVTAVLLRDHTHLRLDEVMEILIYCWRHTEKS